MTTSRNPTAAPAVPSRNASIAPAEIAFFLRCALTVSTCFLRSMSASSLQNLLPLDIT